MMNYKRPDMTIKRVIVHTTIVCLGVSLLTLDINLYLSMLGSAIIGFISVQ
jgi:hypothetical protein